MVGHRTLGSTVLVVLIAASAGCSSSAAPSAPSSSPASSASAATSSAPGSASRAGSAPAGTAADQIAIRSAYVTFFAGKTAAGQKVALLQNGSALQSVIAGQAGSPLATSTTATVSAVTLQSPSAAAVTYTVLLGGKPALENQTGTAVKENGTWKVATRTFCALLGLEGLKPPACQG